MWYCCVTRAELWLSTCYWNELACVMVVLYPEVVLASLVFFKEVFEMMPRRFFRLFQSSCHSSVHLLLTCVHSMFLEAIHVLYDSCVLVQVDDSQSPPTTTNLGDYNTFQYQSKHFILVFGWSLYTMDF